MVRIRVWKSRKFGSRVGQWFEETSAANKRACSREQAPKWRCAGGPIQVARCRVWPCPTSYTLCEICQVPFGDYGHDFGFREEDQTMGAFRSPQFRNGEKRVSQQCDQPYGQNFFPTVTRQIDIQGRDSPPTSWTNIKSDYLFV